MNEQLAWYIGGPVLGLCVVALRWLLNERLGRHERVADAIARRFGSSTGWLLIGLIVGGVVFGSSGRPGRLRLADGDLHRLRAAG